MATEYQCFVAIFLNKLREPVKFFEKNVQKNCQFKKVRNFASQLRNTVTQTATEIDSGA